MLVLPLICGGIGFLAGPLSSFWLRGWVPFGKLHAWLGLLAAVLFAVTAALGYRLQERRSGSSDAHGLLGLLADSRIMLATRLSPNM